MATAEMEFESNVLAYQLALPGYLKDHLEGSHVLLHSGMVCGVFPTEDAARQEGYGRFERGEFITKEILRSDLGMEQHLRQCRG